jgi:hypothetical protein
LSADAKIAAELQADLALVLLILRSNEPGKLKVVRRPEEPESIQFRFMATLTAKSTSGTPVTIVYPAEKPQGHSVIARLRVGKKTISPAYPDGNLPYMVQFRTGQRIVTFMLGDVFETSYLRRILNAYNLRGELTLDEDTKVSPAETKRIIEWLRQESAGWGVPDTGFAKN